jgi:hypothetical protein
MSPSSTSNPTPHASPTADFTSPFTLISADSHSFSIDPLKLAGVSTVFRDMLSSAGGERECKLSESKEEVERFLKAVEKGEVPGGEEEWYGVFKMADKYDAALVRRLLEFPILYVAFPPPFRPFRRPFPFVRAVLGVLPSPSPLMLPSYSSVGATKPSRPLESPQKAPSTVFFSTNSQNSSVFVSFVPFLAYPLRCRAY